MKLIRSNDQHGRFAVWLGIFSSFLITSSALQAAPGGGGGFGAAAGGATGTGAAVGGGGYGGGAAMGGGGHGTALGSGAHASSPGGARSAVGGLGGSSTFGRGMQPGLAGSSNSARMSTGGTAGFGNRYSSAGTVGNYSVPQLSRNVGAYRTSNMVPAQRAAQPNNLWTDRSPAARQATTNGNTLAARQGIRGVYSTGNPNYSAGSYTGRGGSYTTLYPGAYGYNSRSYNDTRSIPAGTRGNQGNGNDGYRHGGRYSHYNVRNYYYPYYGYGYNYFPLLGSYGYYGGYTGLDNGYAGLNNGYAMDNGLDPAPGLGADASNYNNGTAQPYIQDNNANPADGGSSSRDQAAPTDEARPPANAGQQPPPGSSRGPDSLVEAVQSELSNRGYYKGRVDSMFNDDTKEAIRKFQSDNQLVVTGLLNNATLRMLGLN